MIRGHRISVAIPSLNEAEGLRQMLPQVPAWVDEVVVIDNGSTDGSVATARALGARVVPEPRRGYGRACLRFLIHKRLTVSRTRSAREPALVWWSDRLALAGLIGAGMFMAISPALKNVACGLAVLAWVVKTLSTRRWPPTAWLHVPLAVWFLAGTASLVHSVNPLTMINAHPLLGVGLNTFVLNYPSYRAANDSIPSAYAHNSYLHLAAETGWLGLAAFGWLLVGVFRAWRRLVREGDPWISLAATGMGGGILGFLGAGMLESTLQSSSTNFGFWLWVGTLHGLAAR